MNIKIVLVAITFIALACNNSASDADKAKEKTAKTQEDSLFHDVMEGHDIGMAKLGKLKRAIAQTQQSLDSLNKLPAAKLDKQYQQALLDLQEDLNYAEFGMNTWMEEFVLDSAQDNAELRIKYLQSEKDKVTKVRDNILNGLQRADSLLKK